MAKDPLLVKSVEKAFAVLSAFDNGRPTLGLTEIAAMTDMDKSAAQRFTHTLVQLGYLRKCADTRRFQLAPKVLELGAFFTRAHRLIRAATPYLLKIGQETDESVSLSELDGLHVVYLQRLLSRNILSSESVAAGTRLPAYCTAPGMAMLSGRPRAEAVDIIERSELVRYTPRTICDVPMLIEKLDETVARGFAISDDQVFMNHITVAVPIYDAGNRAVAALSVGASKVRCTLADAESRFVPLLVVAASALSDTHPQGRDEAQGRPTEFGAFIPEAERSTRLKRVDR
jgi:DNA-binding IclR family transcriptional regulator